MRYSLRNQDKIKEVLGEDFLKWLLLSLDYTFKNCEIIEYDYEKSQYKIIHVQNRHPKSDSFYELYVIRKTFDVYNLAYKSCVG